MGYKSFVVIGVFGTVCTTDNGLEVPPPPMRIEQPFWPGPEHQLVLQTELTDPQLILQVILVAFAQMCVVRVHVPSMP